ncbi:MAG: 4-hydroxyphenylacetate 3-hydroxylase [Betaproteobacteria bacterium]|nr:4-hydroxyphenylacetate 3-hydroxylase [Betaproteobacteria bacterium]
MFMSGADYRESLRRLKPRVFVHGRQVDSVADAPEFAPGVAAIGLTYDYALRSDLSDLMVATDLATGERTNRMLALHGDSQNLMRKLEAVRVLCRQTGCAQRYLMGDAFNALYQATHRCDADQGTDYRSRFLAYLHRAQREDLAVAIAMTDAKGDRSRRPHQQANADVYVHITERRPGGIVISGTKAIVTSAPYVHELLVMPCRSMTGEDRDFAVCCAVPVDAPGITIVSRPAGRPGQPAAQLSSRYGQSVAVVMFDNVFVPWERVFLAGEWEHSGFLTTTYATHHRHTCIAARAGFGDLLIGAGVLMCEANGLDPARKPHLRDALVELIKIVEGFYACGVAATVYGVKDPAGNFQPEPVYANIGKLLLATQIYDMHRLAHEVSGGLVVALPGPEEDHNPATAASLAEVLGGRPDIPASHRAAVARLVEDLTASDTGGWYSLISLHGGGSPEAMKMEIFRNYPLQDRAQLVETLLDRGVTDDGSGRKLNAQPDRCCAEGCQVPEPVEKVVVPLPRRGGKGS